MTCTVNGVLGPKRPLHVGIHGSESFFLDSYRAGYRVSNSRPPFTRVRMTCPPQVPAGLHSQTFYGGICANSRCLCVQDGEQLSPVFPGEAESDEDWESGEEEEDGEEESDGEAEAAGAAEEA